MKSQFKGLLEYSIHIAGKFRKASKEESRALYGQDVPSQKATEKMLHLRGQHSKAVGILQQYK
jgi:hypothetical protein